MFSKAAHLRKGKSAEARAEQFLVKNGMALLQRNFRCKIGEIDLVMKHQNCIVFVEVRYRKSNHFGGALESVTSAKQDKIKKAAELFLQKNTALDFNECRFDVITATGTKDDYEMQWIDNAFQ